MVDIILSLMRRQKFKINTSHIQVSDDQNQFLDDFLKPPLKPINQSHKNASRIKLQHYSVPTKLKKDKQPKIYQLVGETNKQIKQILKNIKKQQHLRREKTVGLLRKIAQQKQEEKRIHEFRIAQRRIKKRLMLMQRKEKIHHQLLSFVHHSKFQESIPDKILKQKSKSVDDVGQTNTNEKIFKRLEPQTYLPHIKSNKNIARKNMQSLTKELKIQQQQMGKPKRRHRNYLSQVKRRNYTEANQLDKILQQGQISLKKTQRAVQLAQKLQTSRRLRSKNINGAGYKQASRKIQLLHLMHTMQEK